MTGEKIERGHFVSRAKERREMFSETSRCSPGFPTVPFLYVMTLGAAMAFLMTFLSSEVGGEGGRGRKEVKIGKDGKGTTARGRGGQQQSSPGPIIPRRDRRVFLTSSARTGHAESGRVGVGQQAVESDGSKAGRED